MVRKPATKRKKVDGEQLRNALALVFFGDDKGKKYSGRQAAAKFGSLNNKDRVCKAVTSIRSTTSADDDEGIKRAIAERTGGNAGQFASTFTPDEDATNNGNMRAPVGATFN